MDELTPTEAFRARLREARAALDVSQAGLSARLEEIGYVLPRGAIADIERGERRLTLDDAFAIAAALGVAPINLMVPFEDERVISEEAAEEGVFEPLAELAVTAQLRMIPVVARSWIRGTAIYPEAPLDQWWPFYCGEVPPARRFALRRTGEWVKRHARVKGRPVALRELDPPDELREPEMAVPGLTSPENRTGYPASVWTWLMHERGGIDG